MKNVLFSVFTSTFAIMSAATPSKALAGEYHLTNIGFAAPAVNGTSAVASPIELGAIVFDAVGGAFAGYNGTGWVTLSGSGVAVAPTVQVLSGSSTYNRPTNPTPLYIRVRMVGGGGGGGSSGTASGNTNDGSAGGDSKFLVYGGSATIVTAGGGGAGGGGARIATGGTGGTITTSSPALVQIQAAGG